MKIMQRLQMIKAERDCKKVLKNYWEAHKKGIRFSDEYEDKISDLIDMLIKSLVLEKEIKEKNQIIREQKRLLLKNRYKCFYVDYLMSFVMTDKGQILYRGRFLIGLILVMKLRLEMLG